MLEKRLILQVGVIGEPIGGNQTPLRNHDPAPLPSAFKAMVWPPSICCRSGLCRISSMPAAQSMDESASVKVCGWRPHDGGAAHTGGRRTQTSKGDAMG